MISKKTIEAARDAARIEEVVGEFVPLKKNKGCCPFHTERTPSFSVSPSRNMYKCFGCGRGGDSISFLMEKGYSYPDAIVYLANFYKIEIEYAKGEKDPEFDLKTQLRTTAMVMQAHFALSKTEENPGIKYFLDRGFTTETLDHFGVGYCDGIKPQVEPTALAALGITNEKGNITFYKRATIPIKSHSGHIVAWAGRRLDDSVPDSPKYINSPETVLYSKSKLLYNYHGAAPFIRATQEIWIVEGYADVWAMHQEGTRNVVALCGTALTPDHLAAIKKFNGEKPLRIILALDNEISKDKGGYKKEVAKAHVAALKSLLTIGEVLQVEYPRGCKDMGEVVRKGIKVAELSKVDSIQAWVEETFGKDFLKTASPVMVAEMQEEAARMLSDVPKDNVRDIYITNLSTQVGLTPRKMEELVKRFRTSKDLEDKNKRADEWSHIKVCDDYYERMVNYDVFTKSCSYTYVRRKVTELKMEGVSVTSLPRFNNWIIEPEHLEYRRVIEITHEERKYRFFNSYQPLPFKAKEFKLPEGFSLDPENFDYEQIPEIANTARFFKHIFDHKTYGNKYLKIGWDWVALCYLKPTQRLQALALVSSEEGTGKSTFINLMLALFGENATKTDAHRIGQNFNALSAGKLLTCVEETNDSKGTIENILKDLITSFEKVVEAKHQDAKVVKSFDKFIFASNHPEGFMKVGTSTTRFFVMKVNPISNPVKDFEEKLYRELPYLMYFLQKRGVLTPGTNRLWFDPALLENEALLKLRQASKDVVQQNMEELFNNIFLRCELPYPVIRYNTEYLAKMMQRYGGKLYDQKTPNYFQKVATVDLRLFQKKTPARFRLVELEGMGSEQWIVAANWAYTEVSSMGRYIEYPIWRFCSPDEVVSNYTKENVDKLIAAFGRSHDELSEQYGEEPEKWCMKVIALQKETTILEPETMPF